MIEALSRCGAPVVASFVLAGGVLTGKYDDDPAAGRASGLLDQPRLARAAHVGTRLRELAGSLDATPAALAIAYALTNPMVASVLFGATSSTQLHENALAGEVVLDEDALTQLRRVAGP
jgi:aryl-alcohol dehydrogenase-like predicted oxidoreductase